MIYIYIYKICIPINPTERPCYVIKKHHKGQNKLQISACIPIMSLTPIACRILTKLGFLAVYGDTYIYIYINKYTV